MNVIFGGVLDYSHKVGLKYILGMDAGFATMNPSSSLAQLRFCVPGRFCVISQCSTPRCYYMLILLSML